jgi:hypothetical protein
MQPAEPLKFKAHPEAEVQAGLSLVHLALLPRAVALAMLDRLRRAS